MKCPNCGAKMHKNSLYCEICGEDIHIVPDFDTVIEDNMQQTILEIANEIRVESSEESTYEVDNVRKENSRFQGKKMGRVIGAILGIATAVVGLFTIVLYMYYRLQSPDYLIQKAERYCDKQKYTEAMVVYEELIRRDSENIPLKFSLAEICFLANEKEEYEQILLEIIHSPNASMEELNGAYGKLIAIYRAREEYEVIHSLLLESKNEYIIATYNDYIAKAPEYSVPEGYYNEVVPLKISAVGDGAIFYTINGDAPDENSTQYTAPIVLDEGDYLIQAVYRNEMGIFSEITKGTYHITISQLTEPVISAYSGDYKFPTDIEVLEDEENIYYTMDGSDPDISSMQYSLPIHMPVGKSTFKFIRISDGRSSEIVERSYQLVMDTKYMPEDAQRDVLQYAINSGKIYDEWGHSYETQSTFGYEYQYVTNINDVDYFYVVSEVIRDQDGVVTKTGNHFAVNAYTGELFKLQIDEQNNYCLVEIENNP